MSVDLGGVEVAMAEQLLHVTDAGAGAQQMRCAAMAEGVRRGLEFSL